MTEKPLFCFGYGLSYTTFEYGKASVSSNTLDNNEKIKLSIPVMNTGQMDGDEVVQIYMKYNKDDKGPSHALRGLKRVNISKGETVNVEFTLDEEDFEWFDTNNNTMRALEGDYTIYYGGTSEKSKLKKLVIEIQ